MPDLTEPKEGSLTFLQAYSRLALYALAFIGSVWAWRAASGLYDKLIKGE
jgi:hypothetical protein